MRNQIATKIMRTTILAGLIVSILPMNLTAKTFAKKLDIPKKVSISRTYQIAQKPSNEAIDETIKNIITQTNLLKQTRRTIHLTAIPAIGSAVLIGLVLSTLPLPLGPTFTTVITLSVITPSIAFLAAGGYLRNIPATLKGISVGLGKISSLVHKISLSSINKSIRLAKELQNTNKLFPKTTTKKQIKVIEQFYKIIKKPVIKGLIQGLQLKSILKTSVDLAHKQNPDFSKKIIKNYLRKSRKIRNLQSNVDAFNKKIKVRRDTRNKHSKLTPAWHAQNIKLIALKTNPVYAFVKLHLKLLKFKLNKIRKKYTGIKQRLASTVNSYIKNAYETTRNLSVLLAKADTAKK